MTIFPLIKRFQDIKKTHSTVIAKTEMVLYDKCFRSGSVFTVVGWREVNNSPYLIISKGSWEGLLPFEEFEEKMQKVEKI